MEMLTTELSISLPARHWDMLNTYADENELTPSSAASDVLLCAIGEMIAQSDYIDYLMKEGNEST